MKILWFTWKDKKNPLAGGAEAVNESLAERLVRDGHEVVLLVGGFQGGLAEEIHNGYKIIRVGNRWSVYWKAFRYYKKNLVGWADLVIDEMNTIPFFSKYYVQEPNLLLSYQLCREIWFYQMFFPLNWIGYMLEPLYLRLLNDRFLLTESNSAKVDFQKYGFRENKIHVFQVSHDFTPIGSLDEITKFQNPTLLSLGSIRSMKRTIHILEAFEIAKSRIPDLQFIVAGSAEDDSYGEKFLKRLDQSPYKSSITYLGRVSQEKKIELMRKSHAIAVASVKEGWGLIVTEANSQGTVGVGYDVDGLRDSIRHGETGLLADSNTPIGLADQIICLLGDPQLYHRLQKNAWEWSKTLTPENSYQSFLQGLPK